MAGRRFPRLPGRDRLTDGIEVKARDGGHRDRPPRRRRVRPQPGRGRRDRAQPGRLRGRAADGPLGRRRRGAHRGRQALVVNLDRAREIARLALRNLEANQQRIDDLNVYPVPDGDTGTNLTLTVRAIVEALEKSNADGHEAVARELSRAALMGARGNSGVIFSQIVRGFADVLGERDPIDEAMIARAFRSASDAAYRAVRRPVEGTMLTVIREMAEAAESPEARGLDRRRAAQPHRRPRRGVARAHARPARRAQGGRRRRRRRRRAARDHPRRPRRGRRRAGAGGAGRAGGALGRGDAPGAVGVPLLHRVRDRGRRASMPTGSSATSSALGDSLLVVGDSTRAQGARPHGRSRRGAQPRHGERDDRRRRDRRHAPADARARGAARRRSARGPADARDGRSSSSLPARGIAACSRACGRRA